MRAMTPASPTVIQYDGKPTGWSSSASSATGPKNARPHSATHAMQRMLEDAPARAHHSRSKSVEKRLAAPTKRISPTATAARKAGGAIVR